MNADDVAVDIARGRNPDPRASLSLHADAYTEQQWFEIDQRSVIGGTWQWVCHAEKLRQPGAFVADPRAEGIRVNAICPGYIDTPMLEQFFPDGVESEDARAEVEFVHPLRTIGTPTDMANLVFWLASDEERDATGQLWVLDRGLSAQIQQMRF